MPYEEKIEKRKAYEKEKPCLPDPEENGARFLGWIKKRGFYATLEECEAYCCSIKMDLKDFARNMGRDHIMIGRTSSGIVAVKIIDRKWASKWARDYEYDLPHHSHRMKL